MHPSDPTIPPPDSTPTATIVAAIPARWGSTRLPGKPLRLIGTRPMIEHVYRRTQQARGLARVVVLTDDARIAEAVRAFGGDVEMTPADCASGTDRIAFAARAWQADAVINVQGDEPLIDPAAIETVADGLRTSGDRVVTLAAPARASEVEDPNAVKVVCDRSGNALYFSRARIPYQRDPEPASSTPVFKHLGIYGYPRTLLLRLAALRPTPLEQAESLEQLRALENGIPIRVLTIDHAEPGVDTLEDLERAAARLEAAPPSAPPITMANQEPS